MINRCVLPGGEQVAANCALTRAKEPPTPPSAGNSPGGSTDWSCGAVYGVGASNRKQAETHRKQTAVPLADKKVAIWYPLLTLRVRKPLAI